MQPTRKRHRYANQLPENDRSEEIAPDQDADFSQKNIKMICGSLVLDKGPRESLFPIKRAIRHEPRNNHQGSALLRFMTEKPVSYQ